MKLCAGQYKYLLTVYELSKTLKTVRSVELPTVFLLQDPASARC